MSNHLLAASLLALASAALAAPADREFRISGPFTHENLSIFLLHRPGASSATNLLTLAEAMEQKKAAVYETGNVQQLTIENLSSQPIFVQAGDIVKGGKQDRVLITDLLVAPKSGKIPIGSFCVEQGRWTRRGSESADQFNSASAMVPTRALKMAVREPGQQTKVWNEVAAARTDLSAAADGVATGGGVGPSARVSAGPAPGVVEGQVQLRAVSPPPATTSMQMTLEAKKVGAAIDPYVSALSKVALSGDVVGYVYTINGKFSGADAYNSPGLFRRMWPKLLHASAAEALAERGKATGAQQSLDSSIIAKILAEADTGRPGRTQKNGPLAVTRSESDKSIVYVTTQDDTPGAWLHKSYIAK